MAYDTCTDVVREAFALRNGPVPISAYPVVPGGKRPVRNSRPGEFREALHSQTLLPFAEIRRRFERDAPPNLAVICGPPSSGLAVLDFDEPGAFAEFEAEFPKFVADAPVVRTRRGYHVAAVLREKDAIGLLNGPTTFGDLKVKGGFALWPPSHCGGFQRFYERHPCDCPPKPLQGKVLRWLRQARGIYRRPPSARKGGEGLEKAPQSRKAKVVAKATTIPPPYSSMGAHDQRAAAIAATVQGDPILALCGYLQLANGGRWFFLSRRTLMDRCGLTAHAARQALAIMLETGRLTLLEAGTRGPGGRAAYYRLNP